jgi:zinc transporter, ZIP family
MTAPVSVPTPFGDATLLSRCASTTFAVARFPGRRPVEATDVFEALLWGAIAASALLGGAVLAYVFTPSRRVIAIVMSVGTGLLIGSVSFELVEEALKTSTVPLTALFVLLGAGVFSAGDWILAHRGGSERKDPSGAQAEGSAIAIVLGSVLDGIPESFVLGLTVLQGQVSVSLLVGVLLSNLPEGMSSSSGLRIAGWARARVLWMWLAVVVVSAISAAAGYAFLDRRGGYTGSAAQAFAAGALLAMLANTMLPEAYAVEGVWTGPLVVAGFAASIALAAV